MVFRPQYRATRNVSLPRLFLVMWSLWSILISTSMATSAPAAEDNEGTRMHAAVATDPGGPGWPSWEECVLRIPQLVTLHSRTNLTWTALPSVPQRLRVKMMSCGFRNLGLAGMRHLVADAGKGKLRGSPSTAALTPPPKISPRSDAAVNSVPSVKDVAGASRPAVAPAVTTVAPAVAFVPPTFGWMGDSTALRPFIVGSNVVLFPGEPEMSIIRVAHAPRKICRENSLTLVDVIERPGKNITSSSPGGEPNSGSSEEHKRNETSVDGLTTEEETLAVTTTAVTSAAKATTTTKSGSTTTGSAHRARFCYFRFVFMSKAMEEFRHVFLENAAYWEQGSYSFIIITVGNWDLNWKLQSKRKDMPPEFDGRQGDYVAAKRYWLKYVYQMFGIVGEYLEQQKHLVAARERRHARQEAVALSAVGMMEDSVAPGDANPTTVAAAGKDGRDAKAVGSRRRLPTLLIREQYLPNCDTPRFSHPKRQFRECAPFVVPVLIPFYRRVVEPLAWSMNIPVVPGDFLFGRPDAERMLQHTFGPSAKVQVDGDEASSSKSAPSKMSTLFKYCEIPDGLHATKECNILEMELMFNVYDLMTRRGVVQGFGEGKAALEAARRVGALGPPVTAAAASASNPAAAKTNDASVTTAELPVTRPSATPSPVMARLLPHTQSFQDEAVYHRWRREFGGLVAAAVDPPPSDKATSADGVAVRAEAFPMTSGARPFATKVTVDSSTATPSVDRVGSDEHVVSSRAEFSPGDSLIAQSHSPVTPWWQSGDALFFAVVSMVMIAFVARFAFMR